MINSNFFAFDNVSLSEWFMSDTALMNAMPQLSTCFYLPEAHGPPGVKIPVSVLTATSTTTVQGSGQYNSHNARPADTVTALVPTPPSKTLAASQTLSTPSNSPSAPNIPTVATKNTLQTSANQPFSKILGGAGVPEKISAITAAAHSNQISPSPALVFSNIPNPPHPSVLGPSPVLQNENPEAPNPQSKNADAGPKQQNLPTSAKKTDFSNADSSSYYALPSVGLGKPGASEITVSNIVDSMAFSASTIAIIGTSTQPLVHGNGPEITQTAAPPPIREIPILTFAGSTFTPNSASQFIVGHQTLTQGSRITISGVPISLDSGGTIAIIGSSTQNLIHGKGPEFTHTPSLLSRKRQF